MLSLVGFEVTIFLLGSVIAGLSWNGNPDRPDRKLLRGIGAFFMSLAMMIALVDFGHFVHQVIAVRIVLGAMLWFGFLTPLLYMATAAIHRRIYAEEQ